MKIVYIPPALYPALKKAEFRSQDLRDVEKLLSTLSAEDVAFYFAANDARRCPIPKPLADTLENLIFGDSAVMPFTDSEQSKVVLGKLNSINANGGMADMYEDGSVFTSDCVEEDLLIITHTAPDAGLGEIAVQNDKVFYDRVIQQLLAFQPLETVLGSPLLLGWMKSVQACAKSPIA